VVESLPSDAHRLQPVAVTDPPQPTVLQTENKAEAMVEIDIELASQQNFEDTIKQGVTLVDFNAPWCAPCRSQDPIISELKKSYSGRAVVAKVNIDTNQSVAFELGIQSIPTIIIFNAGHEVSRFVGLQPARVLSSALDRVLKA
jgi:thioredoxin 1